MSFTLRPHQERDLASIRRELSRVRSTMLVAACGYGKGVITTTIIDGARAKGTNVLFLVRGRDRVNDMTERVTKLGIEHGVLMGDKKRQRWHKVQIASSDTVHRMKDKPKADTIIIDECHLALSPTFRGVLDEYPEAKIVGLTATPVLGNGKPLGRSAGGIFDSMVKGPSVKQLISEGYLVRSEVIAPPVPADLKSLRKLKTGEFDSEQGASICDNTKIIGDVVDHYKRYASHLKAVAFGFNQGHAYHIAESFRAAGFNWAYVDADTPDGDIHTPGTRKFIWHQYDHGDLQGVASCNVISIGWDHSVCKALLLCGKTSSLPLYHQRLGRGSRPHPGHDHFRVHDHTGNWTEFLDVGPFFESEIDWQLDGSPPKDKEKRISTCDDPVPGMPPTQFTGPYINGVMYPCLKLFDFDPKLTECPYCFIPLIRDARAERSAIEEEAGELQIISKDLRAELEERIRQQSERKAAFLDLLKIQKQRNYKPKFAVAAFKEKFGDFPPRAWNKECQYAAGIR